MQELRPCAHCGTAPSTKDLFSRPHCINEACSFYAIACNAEEWNHRPLEDALRAELERVTQACQGVSSKFWDACKENNALSARLAKLEAVREAGLPMPAERHQPLEEK